MHTYLRNTDIIIKWLCLGALVYAGSTLATLTAINGNDGTFKIALIFNTIFDIATFIIFIVGVGYGISGIFLMLRSVKQRKTIISKRSYQLLGKGIVITGFIFFLFIVYHILIESFGIYGPAQRMVIL